MHNLELLIEEKDKYQNSGRDILSKQKVEKNIETMIYKIDDDMKILEKELFFQKKKKSPDAKQKEDIMKLLKNKFISLKNKSKAKEEEDDENYHKEKAQNLDDFLQKIENNKNNNTQERDIYEEEDEKIKEWNFKKQKEDEMFNEISGLVKGMNSDAKNLGMTIDEMRKKTQKMKNQFENVYDNTKKQTERIDKLNKKI
jgi:hypothetical protein